MKTIENNDFDSFYNNKVFYNKKIMDKPYKYNQTILKIFGYGDCKKIKITLMNCLKTADVEYNLKNRAERGTANENKIEKNVLRSKSKIFELAFCNPWDWFFTGTLNPKKYNRSDLELYHKHLTQWIRNYNKKHHLNIKFLLVPEKHPSDGVSWHMHGFLYGLPVEHLYKFQIGDKMPTKIAEKVNDGEDVYRWLSYENKFGWNDLEPIKNHEAVSKYVTKYINKDLVHSVTELNAHTYYHSRNLKFAETKKKGSMSWANIEPDFKNDYCSIAWIDYSDENYNNLLKQFFN